MLTSGPKMTELLAVLGPSLVCEGIEWRPSLLKILIARLLSWKAEAGIVAAPP
jgi:hypothetical protein